MRRRAAFAAADPVGSKTPVARPAVEVEERNCSVAACDALSAFCAANEDWRSSKPSLHMSMEISSCLRALIEIKRFEQISRCAVSIEIRLAA